MSKWFELVKQSQTVALFTHINSDGDANGSVMAMANLLQDMGKDVFVFVPPPINKNYWFVGSNDVSCKKSAKNYDLAIAFDCPTSKRFGQCEPEFFKAKHSICIDHHLENSNFAEITIVDTEISSACELFFSLLEEENVKITPKIATSIYLGIATDTGEFTHGSHGEVNTRTWQAVAKLSEYGADTRTVNHNMFTHMRRSVFELYKYAMTNVEFHSNGKIALVCIPKDIFEMTGADLTDTHKFIDVIAGIEGVEIMAIMAGKSDNEQAVSVRSHELSAQRICKNFGGGGHLKASGCRLFVPFEIAKQQLLEECKRELSRND